MDTRGYICIGHEYMEEGVREVLAALTQKELVWRPSPGLNSPGFIAWHIVRMEDEYLHGLVLKGPTVWRTGGWYEKFDQHPTDTGTAFSDEEVADFKLPPKDEFLAYAEEVWKTAKGFVNNVPLARLDQPANPELSPRSLAGVLATNIIGHATWHMGESRYLVGMLQ